MGGGSSSLSKQEKQMKEVRRHGLMKAVERFVINVYASFPRIDSMHIILSSDYARSAFEDFLVSERAEEYYRLYCDAGRLIYKTPKPYQLCIEIDNIYNSYIKEKSVMQVLLSPTVTDNFEEILSVRFNLPNDYTERVIQLLTSVKEEAIQTMAREQFNRFLLSKQYKTWRTNESSHAVATTVEDAKEAARTITPLSRQVSFSSPKSDRRKKRRESDLSVRAFIAMDNLEIGRMLKSDSWIASLVAAVEGLPISFCLSSARKEQRGFPIIYVNKAFEKLTGYSRKEVLGKNCKFLQYNLSEKNITQKISDSLKHGKNICTIISNRRKDNSIFKNLLYLKPIFNDKSKYVYVLGFHIDVTKEIDSCESKINLLEELMEMLPDLIITDDDHDEDHNDSCLP